jgi:hypothetical protein
VIVTDEKPIEEILGFLHGHKKVLVVGCDGCTQPPRGLKEAQVYRTMIEIANKLRGENLEVEAITISKQCDSNLLVQSLGPQLEGYDAVLSYACGIGPQMIAQYFPQVSVYPGQNTIMLGAEHREDLNIWEKCQACGDCVLGITGGICPIARCSKSLLNGPCGGSEEGKCEVRPDLPCGWHLIVERLKEMGKLDLIAEVIPPKDWSKSRDGGVRAQSKLYKTPAEEEEEERKRKEKAAKKKKKGGAKK